MKLDEMFFLLNAIEGQQNPGGGKSGGLVEKIDNPILAYRLTKVANKIRDYVDNYLQQIRTTMKKNGERIVMFEKTIKTEGGETETERGTMEESRFQKLTKGKDNYRPIGQPTWQFDDEEKHNEEMKALKNVEETVDIDKINIYDFPDSIEGLGKFFINMGAILEEGKKPKASSNGDKKPKEKDKNPEIV